MLSVTRGVWGCEGLTDGELFGMPERNQLVARIFSIAPIEAHLVSIDSGCGFVQSGRVFHIGGTGGITALHFLCILPAFGAHGRKGGVWSGFYFGASTAQLEMKQWRDLCPETQEKYESYGVKFDKKGDRQKI